MQHSFPAPRQLGVSCTRWRLSSLLTYEAARNGQPAPSITPEEERYLSDKQVSERYCVSRGTVWRWVREAQA